MKRAKVSALRERGLHCVCSAEPQVSESINSLERKADTMKTYILRPFPPVDAQDLQGAEASRAARLSPLPVHSRLTTRITDPAPVLFDMDGRAIAGFGASVLVSRRHTSSS